MSLHHVRYPGLAQPARRGERDEVTGGMNVHNVERARGLLEPVLQGRCAQAGETDTWDDRSGGEQTERHPVEFMGGRFAESAGAAGYHYVVACFTEGFGLVQRDANGTSILTVGTDERHDGEHTHSGLVPVL